MRSFVLPPASLLLLLLSVMTAEGEEPEISSKSVAEEIHLTCKTGTWKGLKGGNEILKLKYKDENSGSYICGSNDGSSTTVMVKFRTCDNCVELDPPSIAGLVVGSLVATVAIAVAVRLVASPPATASVSSNKKRSDKEHLVRNEVILNDSNYQPLNVKGVQTYDKLKPNSGR